MGVCWLTLHYISWSKKEYFLWYKSNNGSNLHHPTVCFSSPPLFRLPLCCPTFSSSCLFTFLHKLTSFLSSLFLKPVRSSCCGRGGSGVKLFPPRARRRACSLDEQAAAWSQSSQVSALRGEQFCGAQKKRCLESWRMIWWWGANTDTRRKETRHRSANLGQEHAVNVWFFFSFFSVCFF